MSYIEEEHNMEENEMSKPTEPPIINENPPNLKSNDQEEETNTLITYECDEPDSKHLVIVNKFCEEVGNETQKVEIK